MSTQCRRWVWLPVFVCLVSWSSVARAAIDELELIVDGGASTFPTPSAYGSATQVSGQHWELTPAVADQSGGITYPSLPVGDTWSVTGEFLTGGGTGADAFYVFGWAASDPAGEDAAHQQYTFACDEWEDQIQVLYDGAVLASVGEAGLDTSTWRQFQVDCTAGLFDVYLDSTLRLTYDDRLHLYGNATGDRFGFGGRTAGSTNEHSVRNMVWNVTTNGNTSALAVSTEGAAPTYPVGTAFGSAVDGGGAWQLNFAVASTHGGVSYSSLALGERFDLTGEFRSGGGTGADIFYAFLWADTEPTWQSDTNGQYAVSFDEYNDQIKLIYDGTTLASYNHSTLDDGAWRPFQVSCDTGVFDVWLDGGLVITYDDSASFFARATGTLSGFAGGSGTETNAHQVRNMAAAVGATSAPAAVWTAPLPRRAFDGAADYASLPDSTIQSDTSLTAEMWFRTNTHGVLLGYQDEVPGGAVTGNYTPALYVGTDGLLRGVFWSEAVGPGPITSAGVVNDGQWHHAALIGDDDQSTLYLDGALVGVALGDIQHFSEIVNQIGVGYTLSWPAGNSSWHYFGGEIGAPTIWDGPLSEATVASIASAPPAAPSLAWSTSSGAVTTYDGVADYTVAPANLIQSRVAMAVETWFRTTETRGGLFGYADQTYPTVPSSHIPSLYIHNDGRLGGGLWAAANPPMFSPSAVNDGSWHHVALVGDVDRHHMYVDGAAVGTYVGPIADIGMDFNQVGLAYTNWVGGANTWDFFRGDIADFNVWDGTLTSAEVATIAAVEPAAEPANLTLAVAGGVDYLDVGADSSLELGDEYTLEAWIRPAGSGANAGNGGAFIDREGEYMLAWWPADESIRYVAGNHATLPWAWVHTGYTTPVGTWRHIALVASATDGAIRLYADGVEVYSADVAGTMTDAIPASDNVRFGERQGVAESFEGDIDEIRIWSVARSAAEILSTHTRSLTAGDVALSTGLVGYWNFDDGTASDLSANTNDGTFTGAAAILGSQQTFGLNGVAPVADASSASAASGPENYIYITGSDADGDALTFALVSTTSDTMLLPLTLVDDDPTDNIATVLYTPSVDGPDSFSFTVTDGIETSAPATVSITVSSPTNYDVALDGSADYIDVGLDASLLITSDLTLEAWVYPTGPGSGVSSQGGAIICREGEYLLQRFADGSIAYAMGNAGWGWGVTTYTAAQDVWTHLAFVYSSTEGMFTLYANGVAVYSTAASGTIADFLPSWNNVWIGNRQSGEAAFDGEIDEVRIWDVARQASEIASTYAKTMSVAEAQAVAGLQGYWTFDGQSADDLTLNANNGTFAGDATVAPSGKVFDANGAAPVADTGTSATVETNETVAIQITGTDGDGDALAFALTSAVSDTLGATLTLTDADATDNLATVTYDATGGAGADTFSFTVSDGIETSAAESVAVTVNLPAVAWATSTGVVTMFDGVDDQETATDSLIHSRTSVTVETWFRTTGTKGVLFGYQNAAHPGTPGNVVPVLYVGTDGLLRGGLWAANPGAPLNSGTAVNDAAWHHAAIVGDVDAHYLYVDGVLTGTYAVAIDHLTMLNNQVGVGWDSGWVGGTGGWTFYRGDLADFNVWDGALAAADVAAIAASPPTQEFPNLTASFAGNADYILVPAAASLDLTTEMTVEAWLYPTAAGSGGASGGTIIAQEGAYTLARWGDGNIYFAVANTSPGFGWAYGGANVPLNAWTHMAFTYSSAAGQVITYIDGVPGTPIAVVGAIGDITPAQNDVWIGEREIAPHAFDGEMDELRVWNVARTAEEIANTYTKSLTPAEAQSVPGLVGYWTFDDGSADDLTLNENDGTFVNQAGAVGSPQTFGANVAPVADPGLSATVFTNEVGDVVITGTDADGDLLSFATTDGASGSFGASLTVSDADTTDNLATVQYGATASLGADTLSFTVSDGIATSAAELVNVTAADPTNRALAVDGSLDYVNAGAAASLAVTDTFTLEAWIYPTGPGSGPNTAPSATTGGGLSGGGDRRSRRRIPASPLRRRHDPVRLQPSGPNVPADRGL
ncbi:hypothetical protein CMK11_12295 [Candidatus Poribacteria bacterium]|nr:hypothetical protein [Candidatus Poribacteria bacterium]